MNAGIIMLQDGKTPCIVYDDALPHPIDHVEFSTEDYRVTLVYKKKRKRGASKFSAPKEGHRFDFPLDHAYVELLKERGNVGVANLIKGQVVDFKIYSVVFTG